MPRPRRPARRPVARPRRPASLNGAATARATVTGTLTTQILLAGAVQNEDAAAYRKIRAAQTRARDARAAWRLEWRRKILAEHAALLDQRAASGRASRRWSMRQQARMVHARLVDLAEGDARVPSLELIRKVLPAPPARA